GRTAGSARRGGTAACVAGPRAPAGHQQPRPAQLRGVAGYHARAARPGAGRPGAGHRKRHPRRRGRGEDAGRRRRRLPGRRSLHARTGSGTGIAPVILRAMTAETPLPYRPLVVFDFDHTLYDGDSGAHFVSWLIKRSAWRKLLALLAAPLLDRKSTRLNSSH